MIEIFQLGQEASKSAFVTALQSIQSQGASVLSTLEAARLNTLVEFDRRLQSINGRRVRAWRVTAAEQAIKFTVSDFTDIDQANTTGTVRADSASVSLRERAVPAEAVIKTKNFSSNKGTIEALDTAQTILRVHTDDFSTPVGQFDIELVTPLTLNQFIIDIVASPSTPNIIVTVSTDGITYTNASRVAINGYRVNVWLSTTEVRFIRVQITPALPDDLNGNTFTFGITEFSAQATKYQLRSDFMTKELQFVPDSEFVIFDAAIDPEVQYYISIYEVGGIQTPFVEINPGDAIRLGTLVNTMVTTTSSLPDSLINISTDLYFNTLSVTENGVPFSIALGLSPSDPNVPNLTKEYVSVIFNSIYYSVRLLNSSGNYAPPRTFAISYVYGPQLINVKLKVRMSTNDSAVSPVFQGASLNSI